MKLSPTKVGAWQDCPRRYFLAYVAKERAGRSWAHLSFGNAVHGALRSWFELPVADRTPERIPEIVERAWSDAGFRDDHQVALWKSRSIEIVRRYLQAVPPDFEPMSTERNLAFKTETFIMEGRIDRLDETATSVSVVDYKTGKNPPTEDDVRSSVALAMYALMVQRSLNRPCAEVALHHVPSGANVTWQHSSDSLERHLSRVSSIADDIARAQDTWQASEQTPDVLDELFPAQPSALCGFCDYWDRCSAGQARSRRREAWEGLAPEDHTDG